MQGKIDFGGIIGLQDNQMSDWQRRFEERGLRFEGETADSGVPAALKCSE